MPSYSRFDRLQEGAATQTIEGTDGQHDRSPGEDHLRVQRGGLSDAGFPAGEAKLIVYLDSTECASCRISHLESYHQLFHLSEETGLFEVVVLLSNTELYGMSILRYVSDQMLEHPIYCDVENKFLRLNPSIPKTALSFHSFLVDHVGVPVCVGDPSMSETMYLIFLKSINKLVK